MVMRKVLSLQLFKVQGFVDGVFKPLFLKFKLLSPRWLRVHADFKIATLFPFSKAPAVLPVLYSLGLSKWLGPEGMMYLSGFWQELFGFLIRMLL